MKHDELSSREKVEEIEPDIFSFLDIREYLQKLYLWRKAKSSNFSYAIWADELGFKSRSFLRLLVQGKRNFTEASISRFVEGLKLNKKSSEYFRNSILFVQSTNLKDKEKYSSRVTKLLSKSQHRLILNSYKFYSSHWGPRLQVLLSTDKILKTPKALSEILRQPQGKIEDYLGILEELDLAKSVDPADKSGEWKAITPTFVAPDQLGHFAIQSFHKMSLRDAVEAIDHPPEERYFRAGIFTLNQNQYRRVTQRLQEYIDNEIERSEEQGASEPQSLSTPKSANANENEDIRLYQLNMNLIPVSDAIHQISSENHEVANVAPKTETELEGDRL